MIIHLYPSTDLESDGSRTPEEEVDTLVSKFKGHLGSDWETLKSRQVSFMSGNLYLKKLRQILEQLTRILKELV